MLFYLNDRFKEPDLDKQVGLLWLGNEFAQLGKEYCEWNVSREQKKCTAEAMNRSAFVSWVDCQLCHACKLTLFLTLGPSCSLG